jgi:hypothetical protein
MGGVKCQGFVFQFCDIKVFWQGIIFGYKLPINAPLQE